MHVFSGIILRSAALQDRVESAFDLSSFSRVDDTGIYEGIAVSDARRNIRFEQPAIEAVVVVEFVEAGIDLPFKSSAPKFGRRRRGGRPGGRGRAAGARGRGC